MRTTTVLLCVSFVSPADAVADGAVRIASRAVSDFDDGRVVQQPFGEAEAHCEFQVVAGGPHRRGDQGVVEPNRERFLDDQPIDCLTVLQKAVNGPNLRDDHIGHVGGPIQCVTVHAGCLVFLVERQTRRPGGPVAWATVSPCQRARTVGIATDRSTV